MKFNYQFSNLLGCVYRAGNLLFSDDDLLISPVGNRLTTFDLKNNKSESLPIESSLNVTTVALSPDGNLLLLVNEEGEAFMCSLRNRCVIHRHHFHEAISSIKFSPDGKKFAVTKDTKVMIYLTPGINKVYNPFVLQRTLFGAYDKNVCLDWSSDSRALAVGCQDMSTRVYASERLENLIIHSLGGHNAAIVGAFFEQDSLNLYTLAANGHICVWDCDTELEELRPPQSDDEEEEGEGEGEDGKGRKDPTNPAVLPKKSSKILYTRSAKHSYREARGADAPYAQVTSVAFHKSAHIILTAFSDGSFYLHELPEFNLIHSLSISDESISSACFSKSGDWLALASASRGQLLVWEWQSETFILKEQGHTNAMTTVAYSPDGHHLATGGDDSKVKLWSSQSGRCVVTFPEHTSAVSGVVFSSKGNFLVTASLDGTVRAFDLKRYRNFKTFTSPRPAQFSCVALDGSSEVVAAGSMDTYEVFLWSVQTGRLLEILAGHEGPISRVAFSPTASVLVSGSWDKSIKLWQLFATGGAGNSRETVQVQSEVLCVTFRPDGKEVAVATLKAQIICYDPDTTDQTAAIECWHDLGYTRKDEDKVTGKKASGNKAFTALCYTADGKCLLAGGQSRYVCIYSVRDQLLLKQFEVTCNMSLDGMQEFLDRRKMTEWGSLALVDDQDSGKKIGLPGVRKGDMSSRSWKPEVRITSLAFSPTGRSWCATTTEGLLVYSLDEILTFAPFDLTEEVTPKAVKKKMAQGDMSYALVLAVRLNDKEIVREVLEATNIEQVSLVIQSLQTPIVDRLISFLAVLLQSSPHVEFYIRWAQALLFERGPAMKSRSVELLPSLTLLQKSLSQKMADLRKVCDYNKYTISYLLALGRRKRRIKEVEGDGSDSEDEAMDLSASQDSAESEEEGDSVNRLEDLSDSEQVATLY